MSKETRREYTLRMRERYAGMRTKQARGRVLNDFCATLGLTRKHAIRVVRGSGDPLRRAGRKAIYGRSAEALKGVWLLFDQPCSKLLHPVMTSRVSAYERHKGALTMEVRQQLLTMSASTIDRLLRGHRVRTSLWRGRGSPANAMKRQVPLREQRWDGRGPGWVETDTVAHCGGSMDGSFANTLTVTDTCSQWTELRAVWNRGGFATSQRLAEIEACLPFELLGINTDNGSEFLNWHVLNHFRSRAVPQTRSRPYHKNDNAHVEQKNGCYVRTLLGYDRFGDLECIEALNNILTLQSIWNNIYRPCRKLLSKTRVGHRYRKTYDAAATPAQRVLANPATTAATKAAIQARLTRYDCLALKLQVDRALEGFYEQFSASHETQTPIPAAAAVPSALRAAPSGTGTAAAAGMARCKVRRALASLRLTQRRDEKPAGRSRRTNVSVS